jgi:hypothetical protein
LASTKEKHATPLQEQFSSIAVLQIQTLVLNEDWEHTFPVIRSFINVGSPVSDHPLVSITSGSFIFSEHYAMSCVILIVHYGSLLLFSPAPTRPSHRGTCVCLISKEVIRVQTALPGCV